MGINLWLRGLASRAILKLDRALCADLHGDKPALRKWPLPYAAMVWFFINTPKGGFAGNPRVYFQQLADLMKEPRREQRRWRMWACWSSCRVVWPDLPGDPKHPVEEPAIDHIATGLQIHGAPNELETWQAAMKAASRDPRLSWIDLRAVPRPGGCMVLDDIHDESSRWSPADCSPAMA